MNQLVPREVLCDRIRSVLSARGITQTEAARIVSDATGRKANRHHVSSALSGKDERYDNLRRDLAVVFLGGAWGIKRVFVSNG